MIYIVWKQAPLEAKGKPLTTEQKRGLARKSRILILLIAFICWCWPQGFVTNELFYGTVFQVLNLTKPMALGHRRALTRSLTEGEKVSRVIRKKLRKGG